MRCLITQLGGRAAGVMLLLVAALGWSQEIRAAPMDTRAVNCASNPGGRAPSGTRYQAYSPQLFQKGIAPAQATLAVPANPVAGQVLMRMESFLPNLTGAAQGAAAAYILCPPGAVERFASNGVLAPGFDNVYRSNLNGIGYRIAYYVNGSDGGQSAYAPVQFVNEFTNGVMIFPFGGSQFGSTIRTSIELIATGGAVSPGVLLTSSISAQSTLSGGGAAPALNLYRVFLNGSVTVAQPTCSAPPQAALTMTLPDLSTTDLVRDGEGPQTNTTISVNCTFSSQNSPSLTIASSYVIPGSTNVLSNISPANNPAEGVGVEVLLGPANPGGSFIQPNFGLAYPSLGAPVGNLPTTAWRFVIGAKLKQTGATNTVRAGPVRATATLTFTYN